MAHTYAYPRGTRTTSSITHADLLTDAERGLRYILKHPEHPDYFKAIKFTLTTLGKDKGYSYQQSSMNITQYNHAPCGDNSDAAGGSQHDPKHR